MRLEPVSDEILMERIREGDRQALGLLLERFWCTLVRFAGTIVSPGDDAEDVVQETFVRVWRHRESWAPSGKVTVYLFRITRNLALNAVRDGQARAQRDAAQGAYVAGPLPRTPAEDFEVDRMRTEVERAISNLPERRREIFIFCRFHGLTHTEIAETLGISPQTVSNQMSSALAELRTALGHHLEP